MNLRIVAIVVVLVGVAIGAIQGANPTALGLPPGAGAWLGIIAAVLHAAQGFLPKVQGE